MAVICLTEGIIAIIIGVALAASVPWWATGIQVRHIIGAIVILFGILFGIIAGLGILAGQRWALKWSGWAYFKWAERPEVKAYFGARPSPPPAAAPAAAPKAVKRPARARFCSSCGAPVSSGDEFCPKCGSKLK